MSLVGPRPIREDEVVKYGKHYAIYKSVRPGVTGLWQVSGRNDTAYAERLRYAEYYVRKLVALARTCTSSPGPSPPCAARVGAY